MELNRRLDPVSTRPLAVAFSGGGDSLALLLIANAWARNVGRKVLVLTVDHGLDPKSAVWTQQAGEAARKLGVDWRPLSWSGDKPTSGLQAASRAARHRLLADAAREMGARVILMGHTADDVRESDLIRQETPSHGRLRPWSPSPAWPQGRGVFLLRPLLASRRDDLRDRLAAEGLGWRDDAANADLRFARARARAELSLRKDTPPLPIIADLDLPLARDFSVTLDGRLVVARRDLAEAPPDVVRRVLGAALLCVAGGTRPPSGPLLERLRTRLAGSTPLTVSIAGARIVANTDTAVVAREAGERARGGLSQVALGIGRAEVFDGRFEAEVSASGFSLAALTGLAAHLDRRDRGRLRAYPAYARPSLPVLIDTEGRLNLPAPFGGGPGQVRALVGDRFAAACGLVSCEADADAASAA